MEKTVQSFYFFFFSLFLLPIEISAQKNSAEALLKWRDSLVSHSLNSWSIANESSTSRPCNWTGIQCDDAGSFVEINLPTSGLDGTLDEFDFSAFPNLTSLNLDMNNLNGSLPVRIGNLSKLGHLDLGSNNFANAIPAEVGSLSELRFLRLFNNSFTGAIPYQLTNLQKIEGIIPVQIAANLTNLRFLNLTQNSFGGKIPVEISRLQKLEELRIGFNMLTGSIPDELASCPTFKSLNYITILFKGQYRLQ
ncbi:hypothetical protein MRB53_015915 [Persea americana]|uniref:Uncharacterized protein n=1 Tax=Persea americana TaxID=3435 RepID=A0ACC2M0D1_PERAE|nr:hypothetical protein MRB53_015915 [Persea americana]